MLNTKEYVAIYFNKSEARFLGPQDTISFPPSIREGVNTYLLKKVFNVSSPSLKIYFEEYCKKLNINPSLK